MFIENLIKSFSGNNENASSFLEIQLKKSALNNIILFIYFKQ